MQVAELEAEAKGLVLAAFGAAEALALGRILTDIALAEGLPVVIDIRTPDRTPYRTPYHAGLPGSAPLNGLWARRKSATALTFHEASLLLGTRNRDTGETLAKHGLDPADHADHGGAVPIRVSGVGVVAAATVSGLPQVDDHRLVVRGIRARMAG